MPDETDWIQAAEETLDEIVLAAGPPALNGPVLAAMAQAQAGMAQAVELRGIREQLRIANVIALAGSQTIPHLTCREALDVLTHRVPDPSMPGDVGYPLRPDIAAALGIQDGA